MQKPNTIPLIAVLLLAKVNEPLVEILPAAVVVAFPPTHNSPLAEVLVVEALPKVDKPTTVKVPKVAKLPLVAVVVAKPFTHKLPVVVICDVEALPKVVKPTAVNVPKVAKLPLEAVVVAKPFTHKLPVVVMCVVEALPKVDKPTAVKVPKVAKLPLEAVVVAKPFTHRLPLAVNCVVEALPKASMAKSSVPSTLWIRNKSAVWPLYPLNVKGIPTVEVASTVNWESPETEVVPIKNWSAIAVG